MDITPNTPLTSFPGVGEVRAKKLEKLGLSTAASLLSWYPRPSRGASRMAYTVRRSS